MADVLERRCKRGGTGPAAARLAGCTCGPRGRTGRPPFHLKTTFVIISIYSLASAA